MDRFPNYGIGAPELRVSTSGPLAGSNDPKRRNSADLFNTRDHLLFAWPTDVVYQDDLLRDHSRRLSTDSVFSSNSSPVENISMRGSHSDPASGVARINRFGYHDPYTEVFPGVTAGDEMDSGGIAGMRSRGSFARAAGLTDHLKRVARESKHWEALHELESNSK